MNTSADDAREDRPATMARRRGGLAGAVALTLAAAAGVLVLGDRNADQAPATTRQPAQAELGRQEITVLDRAQRILADQCMVRRGFTRDDEARAAVTVPDPGPPQFRYVIDDPAWARTRGYGLAERRRAMAARAASAGQRRHESLPAAAKLAYDRAYTGGDRPDLSAVAPTGVTVQASADGCLADAQRRLYGDLHRWFTARVTANNLAPAVMNAVWRDPRYGSAEQVWARCMRAAGVPVAGPRAARAEADRRGAGRPAVQAHAAEVAVATAEATCARTTGFGAVVRRIDREHSAAFQATYAGQLDAHRRLQRAALPRARAVVAGSGLG
jgi:hypothetical protein